MDPDWQKFDPEKLEHMSAEELAQVQNAILANLTGSPTNPRHPSDAFESIAVALNEVAELLRWVEGQLQREPPLFARIQFEDTQTQLLSQRQKLRRDWQALLGQTYRATN